MKLKKLFSAKKSVCTIIAGFSALFFFSCTSVNLSVPVPGQGAAKTRNIYAEYYNLGEFTVYRALGGKIGGNVKV